MDMVVTDFAIFAEETPEEIKKYIDRKMALIKSFVESATYCTLWDTSKGECIYVHGILDILDGGNKIPCSKISTTVRKWFESLAGYMHESSRNGSLDRNFNVVLDENDEPEDHLVTRIEVTVGHGDDTLLITAYPENSKDDVVQFIKFCPVCEPGEWPLEDDEPPKKTSKKSKKTSKKKSK